MEQIRVLLVDDHAQFRAGMRAMLQREADMVVIGEAVTGAEAIQTAVTEQPDVVLMDLHMPDVNGIEATRQIVTASPPCACW